MAPNDGLDVKFKNVSFTINNQPYTGEFQLSYLHLFSSVNSILLNPVHSGEVSADLNLAVFIRERAALTGTKIMCSQVRPNFWFNI